MRLTILFLLLAQILFGQTSAPLNPVLKFQISNPGSTGTYPNFTVSGFVSDDLGRWDALSVSVGDSLYLLNGSDLIVSVITTINSAAGNSLNVTVNCKNPGTPSLDPGQAVIVHPTLTYQFPTFTSGLRNDLQAAVMNRFSQLVEEQLYDADEIAFTTGSVPPNNSVATSQGYRLAKNQSGNGDLYSWNGSAWVLAGGSVAVPAPRIPYGTGSGITSTPAMRFDSVTSNGQYTQRILSVGDTVTNANRRIEAIEINNTYGRIGTGGLGRGWGYSPLKFRSPTKCTECTDFRFNHQTSTNQDYGGTPGDSTLNEVVKWGFNIDGAEKPSARGLWYAMEPNWYNGGQLWHEYHLEFYNPLFTQPSFTSLWGNFGTTRRLFTTEIQNSKSPTGMTNQWQFIGDSWFLRSLKSNTQYFLAGFDESSRISNFQLYSGRLSSLGFQLLVDSAGASTTLRRIGPRASNFFISGYNGYYVSDHLNRSIINYSDIREMYFGDISNVMAYRFFCKSANSGYGVGIIGDHTSNPQYSPRGQLQIYGTTDNGLMNLGVYTPFPNSDDSSYAYINSYTAKKGLRLAGEQIVIGKIGVSNNYHVNPSNYMTVRCDGPGYPSSGQGKTTLRAENHALGSNVRAFTAYTKENIGKALAIENNTGESVLYRSNATPEGVITANPGDWCFVNNSGTGEVYLKSTGTGNAGWTKSNVNTNTLMREESFTATAGQTAFTIAYNAPVPSGTSIPVRVYRNGVRLFYVASGPTITQFTYSGTTVTTAANALNDIITVEYLN